jgi:LysM repeat protein
MQEYIVQKGDTLYSISRKFGTTVTDIIELNNLKTTVINVGQKLLIP